jgi:DNA-binding NarL/FixJ family response regulator
LGSILVVDDHPIVARDCGLVLGDAESVVAAHDARSGYEAFLALKPDVVILDLSFQEEVMGGIVLARLIRSAAPLARILVFSMHADLNFVRLAIKAGARGYLLKDSAPDELPKAVRQIRSGDRYFDERIKIGSLTFADTEAPALPRLTQREQQVLTLLGGGRSYPEIATELGITRRALARITYGAKLKLGISRPSDLLRRAGEFARGEGH